MSSNLGQRGFIETTIGHCRYYHYSAGVVIGVDAEGIRRIIEWRRELKEGVENMIEVIGNLTPHSKSMSKTNCFIP